MDEPEQKPIASVFRLDPDLSVHRLFEEVGCANGTCFSADGRTMWFADSAKAEIEAFDYDIATGTPSNRRRIARISGVPDGSCIDSEGYVWNVVWEGYRVDRYAPDGRLDRTVELPVKKVTCCAFGGNDLSTLFITTSRYAESEHDLAARPTAGGLYAVRPGIAGILDAPFAG
jgi:L-arabinonolactonase